MKPSYKTTEQRERVLLAGVDKEGSSEEVKLIKSLRMKTNTEQRTTWMGEWNGRGSVG